MKIVEQYTRDEVIYLFKMHCKSMGNCKRCMDSFYCFKDLGVECFDLFNDWQRFRVAIIDGEIYYIKDGVFNE